MQIHTSLSSHEAGFCLPFEILILSYLHAPQASNYKQQYRQDIQQQKHQVLKKNIIH